MVQTEGFSMARTQTQCIHSSVKSVGGIGTAGCRRPCTLSKHTCAAGRPQHRSNLSRIVPGG